MIRGNCERDPSDWDREQLEASDLEWAAGLPATATLDGVLYCHATPTSDLPITTAVTDDAIVAQSFDGVVGTVVIGHTHHQFDRRVGDLRVVNAGSVGMPYEGDVAAFWAMVEDGEPRPMRTSIDVERAVAGIRASGWPAGEEFIAENLLVAVSRDEAIEQLECAAAMTDRVQIGRVGRPHGIDGAFFIEQPSSDDRWWQPGARFLAGGREAEVVAARRSSGRPVVKLDRDVARGALIEVELDALPPTEDDEYYAFQLVGLPVVEETGRELGIVKAVTPGVANDVLELEGGVLLPMIEDCVRAVDLESGRIVVAPGFAE